MENEAIAEGISPGGLNSDLEIKILVCYLLKSVGRPISKTQLNSAVSEHGLVNYFDLSGALSELLRSEHIRLIQENGEEYYAIAPLGEQTADSLGKSIPASVKEKALSVCMRLLARLQTEKETDVSIDRTADGFVVRLAILDEGTDLMHLGLFVPDLLQAEKVREQFLAAPGPFYEELMETLLKDRS